MKQAIVHAGLHRCASTAIQKLLEAMRPQIEAAGTDLVLRGDTDAGYRLGQLRAIPRASSTGPTGWWRRTCGASGLAALHRDKLLVSEEALLGTMPGYRDHGLYPRRDKIWAAFAGWGTHEVHPRLLVRRQDKWLESIYAFLVARGLASDFNDFVAGFDPAQMDYTSLLATLDNFSLLDRTRIGVLEDWNRRGALKSALGFFELPHAAQGVRFQSHGRLPPHTLRILLALNRSLGEKFGLKQQVSINRAIRKLKPVASHDEIAAVLEAALPPDLLGDIPQVLGAHDPALPVTFTDDQRTRWRTSLKQINRRFLSHAAVGVDPGVWEDD